MALPPSVPPPPADPPVAVCYRHPDRRAGVGCQRCGRPICPSCMHTASVGFQCPECVKAAGSRTRVITARDGVFGSVAPPVLTIGLIVVNVAMFLLSRLGAAGPSGTGLQERWLLFGPCVGEQWYRIVTGGFLHANLLHLGMNMYVLWLVGQVLEPVLGRLRFGLVYGVSLLGGSAGALLLSPTSPTVGASGAIFGLFGAMLAVQMARGISPWRSGIAATIGLNLVITFAFASFISVGGHLGGLVVGGAAGAGLAVGTDPGRQSPAERHAREAGVAVLGAAMVLTCLVVAGRAGVSPPGTCP